MMMLTQYSYSYYLLSVIYDGNYVQNRNVNSKASSTEPSQERSKPLQMRLDFITNSNFWGCPQPFVELDSGMSPVVLEKAKQIFLSERKQNDYEEQCWRLFDINQKLYPQATDTEGYQDETIRQVLTSLK